MFNKNYSFYFITSILVVIVLIVIGFQNLILSNLIHKAEKILESKYAWQIQTIHPKWHGLTGIQLNNVHIINSQKASVLKADTILIRISWVNLLWGRKKITSFVLKNGELNLPFVKKNENLSDSLSNTINLKPNQKNFVELLKTKFEQNFDKIPEKLFINHFKVNYILAETPNYINIESIELQQNDINAFCTFFDGFAEHYFSIRGVIKKRSGYVKLQVNHKNYSENKTIFFSNFNANFKTFFFELKYLKHKNYRQFVTLLTAENPCINHPKISSEPFKFDTFASHCLLNLYSQNIMLDSTSYIYFNGFTFPFFINYQATQNTISLKIPKTKFVAQHFFEALPQQVFKAISGIQTNGNLTFSLSVFIDRNNSDSVFLHSTCIPEEFRIKKFGEANLNILNDTFTLYRNEPGFQAIKLKIDSTLPSYTKFCDISPYLIYSVLTSEDGSFFYHHGFNIEALAQSLSENIKKQRFARGGSTITMQLVRNVFLHRKKTLSRKFEEIVLTWLLENNNISKKQKLLEIYLNIIEWGPGIYGIQEASQFYFKKKPSQLTLQESIFLASIIPSPKKFKYAFVENGLLKQYYQAYFKKLANIMLSRNQILPSDTIGLDIKLMLTGKAKEQLILQNDSTLLKDEEFFKIDFDDEENE